ncbi:hypothetical protein [Mesorhizobium sp. ORM16]|uniref:hypothetical protein n=1 Tax=Mesorhizobium sp. ORM16 TaxID=3376989 RepID=UPI0038573CA1
MTETKCFGPWDARRKSLSTTTYADWNAEGNDPKAVEIGAGISELACLVPTLPTSDGILQRR